MKNKYNQREEEARKRYQNLSEEEIEKNCQHHLERHKNLSEKEKQKQVEYMRNYYSEITFELLLRFFKDHRENKFLSQISPCNVKKILNFFMSLKILL